MAVTDFGALQPNEKRAWGHAAYKDFRDNFFFKDMMGKGRGAIVELVDELSTTDAGTSAAMLRLVPDLAGTGIVNDNDQEGHEEALSSKWQEITIGQLSNAVINKGRLDDQKSVINFRKEARPALGYWLANAIEQQLVLAASGISFAFNTNGSARTVLAGQDAWTDLPYAADVVAPSTNRHIRWDASTGIEAGDTTAVAAADVPVYAMIVDVMAEAQVRGVPCLKIGGKDYYKFLIDPRTMAHLYKDSNFRTVITQGGARGESNPIFNNSVVTMHGAILTPWNKVYNTSGTATKWGSGNAIEGTRSLLLGSQALALADLESPQWVEKEFNYNRKKGVAISKLLGVLKPQFYAAKHGTVEDFGVMCIDHAL